MKGNRKGFNNCHKSRESRLAMACIWFLGFGALWLRQIIIAADPRVTRETLEFMLHRAGRDSADAPQAPRIHKGLTDSSNNRRRSASKTHRIQRYMLLSRRGGPYGCLHTQHGVDIGT